MSKFGILGGTFDPIHNGHLALGMACAKELHLGRILLIPTAAPPHKTAGETPAGHRLEMCRLAAEEFHGLSDFSFGVSDIEILRGGKSYTSDTLPDLKKIYINADFHLIMGADMFVTLRQWHQFEKLKETAVFCVCPRVGAYVPGHVLSEYADGLKHDGCRVRIIPADLPEISSSQIRKLIAQGKPVTGLIPESVERYIVENGVYFTN